MRWLLATTALSLLLLSCSGAGNRVVTAPISTEDVESAEELIPAETTPPPEYIVDFLDRSIDLEPYFDGFRYRWFRPQFEAGRLFYQEETPEGRFLLSLALDGELDLSRGVRLADIDWSTRSLWALKFHAPSNSLLLLGDEQNAEVNNIYQMNLDSGELAQLTAAPYVYAYGVGGADQNRLGFVARYGDEEPFHTCFEVYNLATEEYNEIACDSPEHRLVWGNVSWSPDGDRVVLTVNDDGDRNRPNLVMIDTTDIDPTLRVLLPGAVRYGANVIEDWLDDHTFAYYSEETGYRNLYSYNTEDDETRQITHFTEETSGVDIFEVDGRPIVGAILKRPHESELVLVDVETGETLGSRIFDATIYLRDAEGNRGALVATSLQTPFQLLEVVLGPAEAGELNRELNRELNGVLNIEVQLLAEVPAELSERISACEVERIEFPTFDIDPATDRTRQLHAFLMTPRGQLPEEQRLARITSFYGGGNSFNRETQMLCEAGIATLSPAPRGSWGFGADFSALNDRDLGGDEIVDIIYAGRWLSEHLDLDPSQIGVYGGSHGGYAAMRLLTFPPETNERDESFDWGFGMSHAGFSNILTFYEACNIPDWVTHEAGDPVTEADKLLDRSPISHVDLLEAPILLTHGENDLRVPVGESRRFATAASRLNPLLVRYVEFEGQGHGIGGLNNRLRYYQVVFSFLEFVIDRNSAGTTPPF